MINAEDAQPVQRPINYAFAKYIPGNCR